MELEKYKIKKIGKRGDFDIFVVDGQKIRDELDIEFTNFGQHYRFDYIPLYEFWLDAEGEENERNYFIDHLLVEWKAMNEGLTYEDALSMGREEEIKERHKSKRSERILDPMGRIVIEKIHKELLGKANDELSIWIVNGKTIRDNFDTDFTEGGHDLVYDFVPEREVWLDDDLVGKERPYVLLHELHERNLMSKGFNYDNAHGGLGEVKGASEVEWEARHDENKLRDYLNNLGYKL